MYKFDFIDPLATLDEDVLIESGLEPSELLIQVTKNEAPSVVLVQSIEYGAGVGSGSITLTVSGAEA